jgi:hypothetical protein
MAGPLDTLLTAGNLYVSDSIGGTGGSPYAAATWNGPYKQIAFLVDSHLTNAVSGGVGEGGVPIYFHRDADVLVSADFTGATARSTPITANSSVLHTMIDELVAAWAEITGNAGSTFHTASAPAMSLAAINTALSGSLTAAHVPGSGITGTVPASVIDSAIARAANVPTLTGVGATGLWSGITLAGSQLGQGSVGDDRLAGLWYTAGATAMTVVVTGKNVWNVSQFIQFQGGTSPAISLVTAATGVAIPSGQARIDLLYLDASGTLQWQQGTPAPILSAQVPGPPANAFVPIVYVKVRSGATSITGYTDQGHDAYFLADARTGTTPLSAAALGAHTVALSRIQDGAAAQTSPASTTINVGALDYWNSAGVAEFYGGGSYTYTPSPTNTQPRWDILYLDDNKTLQVSTGTQGASPVPNTVQIGWWPVALIYLQANTIAIVDQGNYTGASQQGYIRPMSGYQRSMTTGTTITSAVLGTPVVSGGVITSIPVTSGGGGYPVAPAIIITGTHTVQATAHATMAGGVVTGIVVDNGGTGYGSPTASASSSGAIQPLILGGTGGTDQPSARAGIGAAASGANSDITSVTALAAATGNISFAGTNTFAPPSTSDIAMIVNGLGGQTGDLQQYQVNGTLLGRFTAAGAMTAGGAHAAGGTIHAVTPTAAGVGLIVDNGAATPTGDLAQYKAGGSIVANWTIDGRLGVGNAALGNTGIAHRGTVAPVGSPIGYYEAATLRPGSAGQSIFGFYSFPTLDASTFAATAAYGYYVPTLVKTGANAITTVAGIYAEAQNAGTNNYAGYFNGATKVTGGVIGESDAGGGVFDGSSYNPSKSRFSGLLSGLSNEFGVAVQTTVPATGATADYQKSALSGYILTNDISAAHSFDATGGDFRAIGGASNTNSRLWALVAEINILSGGDGGGVIMEGDIVNAGTDVSAIAGGTAKMKGGINLISEGPQPATFGYMLSGTSTFHHGLYAYSANIGTTAGDSFIELQSLWRVTSTGQTAIGSNAPTTGTMLDVTGSTRYTGIERKGMAARTVPVTGGTLTPTSDIIRINPAGAITGILVGAGTGDGGAAAGAAQVLTIVNESAFTVTFAAYNGTTACILDGVSNPMPATSARSWTWDPAAGAWYRNQ